MTFMIDLFRNHLFDHEFQRLRWFIVRCLLRKLMNGWIDTNLMSNFCCVEVRSASGYDMKSQLCTANVATVYCVVQDKSHVLILLSAPTLLST